MDVGDGPFPQPWSPDNARQILQWTIDNKYDDVVVGFELGNEQNSKYSGKDIAVNFGILHKLLDEMWPGTPMLCGPDPHSYHSAHDVNSWIGTLASPFGSTELWLVRCSAVCGRMCNRISEVCPSEFDSLKIAL